MLRFEQVPHDEEAVRAISDDGIVCFMIFDRESKEFSAFAGMKSSELRQIADELDRLNNAERK